MDTRDGRIYTEDQVMAMEPADQVYMRRLAGPITTAQQASMKVGRNDPCPCGSGRKFKRCHMVRPRNPVAV